MMKSNEKTGDVVYINIFRGINSNTIWCAYQNKDIYVIMKARYPI